MRQLILNFQNDSEPAGGMKTSSSLAGSLDHANRTQWPESDLERKMNATCGPRCLERFGKFNHVGSWAKTFSALLIGRTDWYSTRCKLTWKLKGTKYNRLYFQLQPSTLPIEETGFGLLPTPTASEVMQEGMNGGAIEIYIDNTGKPRRRLENGSASMGVARMAQAGLLPTPTAMDSSGATANMKSTQVKEGSMHSVTLSRALGMGLLPTPTAVQREHPDRVEALKASGAQTMFSRVNGEARPNSILDHLHFHGMLPTPMASDCGEKVTGLETQDSLVKITREMTGKTSQLSHQFVCEMMGFPPNYLDLW